MSNAFELPENVAKRTASSRCWNGVNVDLHELTCTGRFLFRIGREESSRLSAQLEQVGRDHAEPRSAPNTPNPHAYKPRSMYFAPAEMPLWGYSADTRYVKCATISFDVKMLQERLGISESVGLMDVPRLRI